MRRTGIPSIITSHGKRHALSRVNFSDQHIKEDFLQVTLHKFPEILPVEDLDRSYAPLVSLGREIIKIDNLFITPTGNLTLVETKLWRNPEATREVVAQVLDYASRLSAWHYSDLEDAARNAPYPAPIGDGTLYEYVAGRFPNEVLPEAEFVDAVQRNLRDARFLLLVVGDGIKENLENILDQLHRQPQMLYKFCLVEIHIYENPEILDGRLLMPIVVANTTEIVRTLVRVQTTGSAPVSVSVEAQIETPTSGGTRRTLSEDLFFEEIKDADTARLYRRLLALAPEIGAELTWGASAVSIQLPDPKGAGKLLTLFLLRTNGEVLIRYLAMQLEKISMDTTISYNFAQRVSALFPGITTHKKYPDWLSRGIKSSELETKVDDFISIVRDTVTKIRKQTEVGEQGVAPYVAQSAPSGER